MRTPAQGRSLWLLGRCRPAQPSRFNEQPLSGTAELGGARARFVYYLLRT